MSFNPFEKSRTKGRPIDLYFFQYGPSPLEFIAQTNAEQTVTFNNVEYKPVPIQRPKITSNGTLDKSTLSLEVAHNHDVVTMFRVSPPEDTVNLIIYQGHINDPDKDFKAIWNGRVTGAGVEGFKGTLSCTPISSERRRTGLRRFYQYGCPHVLYSTGAGRCNADKTAATFPVTVSGISGATVTLPTGWFDSSLSARFNNGLFEYTRADGIAASRTILQVAGNDLLLSEAPTGLAVGDTVNVIYGCGHDMDACQQVHRNLVNFGGMPWIPTKNPVGNYNNFY